MSASDKGRRLVGGGRRRHVRKRVTVVRAKESGGVRKKEILVCTIIVW